MHQNIATAPAEIRPSTSSNFSKVTAAMAAGGATTMTEVLPRLDFKLTN